MYGHKAKRRRRWSSRLEGGAKEKALRRLRENLGEQSTTALLHQRTTGVTALVQQGRISRR